MPLDPPTAGLLQLIEHAGAPALSQGGVAQARAGFRTMTVDLRDPATLAPVASTEDVTLPGGLRARVYRPEVTGPVPTVVFFHGGGFVLGDIETHEDQARLLCRDVGAVVVSVDYRLAPEAPFPAAAEDALTSTRWAADHVADLGGDRARLAVAGDSAGGNLAAGVALAFANEGLPLAAQLLLYPAVDFEETLHPSRVEKASGFFLTADDMLWFGQQYLPAGTDRRDPRASVLHATLPAGLAPAVVATAEHDPLRDEGEAYAAALAAAGVPVVVRRFDGLIHGFFGLTALSPASADAGRTCCADLRSLLA